MSAQRSIIIDTDPGQDDAFAILLALASPELDVLGVTAVAGNVPLALTQRNIRVVCELAGRRDMPTFAGAVRPLVRPLVTAEHVHGKTGLDGADLPEPTMVLQSQHAVDFIVETIMNRPEGEVTMCTLGPLTNLALAIIKEPKIVPRIRELVMMGGGCFEGGNITAAAEFNIYVDPHAAQIVMESGMPITMIPLDCTHKALTSAQRIGAFRALGTQIGEACAGWMEFFERFDEDKYGTDGGPLHDPNVIAYLLDPTIYTGRHINVEIETMSPLTMGMTVADWWGVTERKPNTNFIRDLDDAAFYAMLLARISTL
ncbi:MAG: nucleoside hydrolase [Rhizobiales bacterium]|nr:nucleoside hydrolase [Hyphomicrobiales bacterium]